MIVLKIYFRFIPLEAHGCVSLIFFKMQLVLHEEDLCVYSVKILTRHGTINRRDLTYRSC